jgi:hypothetical protein
MFEFLFMAPYEQRKVANFSNGKDMIVDTCSVNDSSRPFETGIASPFYNKGEWVIVEEYDTKKQAQVGHDKWVKIMTTQPLPETIKDVSSCGLIEFGKALGVDLNEEYPKKETLK